MSATPGSVVSIAIDVDALGDQLRSRLVAINEVGIDLLGSLYTERTRRAGRTMPAVVRPTWADVPADTIRTIGPVRIVRKVGAMHVSFCRCGSIAGPNNRNQAARFVLRHRRCNP